MLVSTTAWRLCSDLTLGSYSSKPAAEEVKSSTTNCSASEATCSNARACSKRLSCSVI